MINGFKIKFLLLFTTLLIVNKSHIKAQEIVYHLPKSVEKRISDYLGGSEIDKNMTVYLYMVDAGIGKHSVSVILDSKSADSLKLITQKVAMLSNRYVSIKEKHYPLIFREDIVFANLGSRVLEDGRVARTRITFTPHSYSITFNRDGEIFEDE